MSWESILDRRNRKYRGREAGGMAGSWKEVRAVGRVAVVRLEM